MFYTYKMNEYYRLLGTAWLTIDTLRRDDSTGWDALEVEVANFMNDYLRTP